MKLNETLGVSSFMVFIGNVISQHMSNAVQNVQISVTPAEAKVNSTV